MLRQRNNYNQQNNYTTFDLKDTISEYLGIGF